jgi:hypothetical protein
VYFVLLAAALAILAGVVVVAMGKGGEIAQSRRDLPLLPARIRTAADVTMLRLPLGLYGYAEDATDEALDAAARLIAEQNAEIARLRDELWRMRMHRSADPRPGLRSISSLAEQAPEDEAAPSDGRDMHAEGAGDPNDAGEPSEPDVGQPELRQPEVRQPGAVDSDADDAVLRGRAPVGGQPWPKP